MPGNKLPIGSENWRGGCNAPGRPEYEGQVKRFRSPFARDVVLTDVAKRDKYGALSWVAQS